MNSIPAIRWDDHKQSVVDTIVDRWNAVCDTWANSTIRLCMEMKEMLDAYDDLTKLEIVRRVKSHPDRKPLISGDRIYQGWRLIENNPNLAQQILHPEKIDALPEIDKPIMKRDGSVAVEHYFELYKRPGLIDETMKTQLETEAKTQGYTVKKLKERIREVSMELRSPDQKIRIEKDILISEIMCELRYLQIEYLRGVKNFIHELKKS